MSHYNAAVAEPFQIIDNPEPRAWDDFVCAHNGHLLQSFAWGELKQRLGWTATQVAVQRGDDLVAGAQILLRQLPLGLRLAYVPRGPVVDPADGTALAAVLEAACASARAQGAFALKLEPDWPAPVFDGGIPEPLHGFRPGASHQPRTTIHLDLGRDLDTILAQMKPKWRYNIRLAARKGVSVREGTPADVPLFYQLLQVTGRRDHFALHSLEYYEAAFRLLREHARLFIAEYEREPLAAIFVTAFGRQAIYLYGASSDAHRERMPNHAVHWAAIQWARARGCTCYDLWGIPDDGRKVRDERGEMKDEKRATGFLSSFYAHPSSLPEGLYQFKQGFGGCVVRYVGAFDKVFSEAKFALYSRALAFRRGGNG